jgi:cyclic 2,3-diphosphoglycerate synthetase
MGKIGCLVDGEHYIDNIAGTLSEVAQEADLGVAIFIGGTEKVGSKEDIRKRIPFPLEFAETDGKPDVQRIGEIATEYGVEEVLDLSDEPVVNYDIRMELACELLSRGMVYRGADFRFDPMRFKRILTKPSLSIWGTGKRIGKTAIGGFVARTLREAGMSPCVVTLGRGGPDTPEVLRGDEIQVDAEFLLEMHRKGFHAASDYFEDALTARVFTIGCRRCGGGLAGRPYNTIVEEGARMADQHPDVDVVILEGSGATFPEIASDRVILLIGAAQPLHHILGFLGPYRIRFADLVILAMCEEPMASREKVRSIVEGIKAIKPGVPVVETVFRPQPLEDIQGKKVFFASTAPEDVMSKLASYLEEEHGCQVVGRSNKLSNRPRLREDLAAGLADADVLLTELKAAAVDVAVKEAKGAGIEAVFCDNIPVVTGEGETGGDLSEAILGLLDRP